MLFKDKFKNKKSKIIIGITTALCLTIGITYAFNRGKDVEVSSEDDIPYIETYVIPENEKVYINGIVMPKQSQDINLSEGEEVDSLKVENGQSVKKGDTLFTCKNQSILNEISELKAQISQLQSSQDPNDNSLNIEINKLNAQIKSLSEKASVTYYAPFDGNVHLNEVSKDSEVANSYITVQSNEFYMQGQASEQDLAKIKIDQTAKVLVFSTNQELMGRISFISQRPTNSSSNDYQQQSNLSYYDINISFDSQDGLVNGFHVQASVILDDAYTKVPVSSILGSEGDYYVFKDLNGILKKQIIEIDSQTEEFAVVKSGLSENDVILKNPTEEMQEGQSLTLYENPENIQNTSKDITGEESEVE
ncbi:efflux RND transporter periplasmic adaptor subunit [Romboutsia sp. 1001713B170207_170306_H8]|uniref:efflux RND transporter periplasmic adaptor subunit n=1 Tax=Romboutsia sp. 1001713B170207_170306_H8 TaxID=2787112 RepID=UPI0008216799|nr:biotin/lipoyl-binding protein [Romboutsia sp. 1001713B170207_170306_H8]SCH75650.1 efflux transporter%2C RND family%2C MFP subunit [uncultured Clostridium sp.]